MTDRRLLLSQKNEVFHLVRATGFVPTDFRWETSRNDHGSMSDGCVEFPRLVHAPTGYFFTFDYLRNSDAPFYSWFSPGKETVSEVRSHASWSGQLIDVREWLGFIAREIDEPDAWEAFLHAERPDMVAFEAANVPFTVGERELIKARLSEIRQVLLSQVLDERRQEVICQRLAYIEQSLERLGRKDWTLLLLGVLIQTALEAGLKSSIVHQAFLLATNLMSDLFGRLKALTSS